LVKKVAGLKQPTRTLRYSVIWNSHLYVWNNKSLLCIACCDLLSGIWTVWGRYFIVQQDSQACIAQGFFIQTFLLAPVFWSLTFCIKMLDCILHALNKSKRFDDNKWWVHLINWTIPLTIGLAFCFIQDSNGNSGYGNAILWCWISSSFSAYRLGFFYGPLWLVFLFALGVLIYMIVLVNKKFGCGKSCKKFKRWRYKTIAQIGSLDGFLFLCIRFDLVTCIHK